MDPLAQVRKQFALDLQRRLALRSTALVDAFATVPREKFVRPGPWLLSDGRSSGGDPYQQTHSLDSSRELNNGRPFNHARWLDELEIEAGDHVLHVGAGSGYYTAILASIVGPTGLVTAAEVDPVLLAELRENTAAMPQVSVVEPRGLDFDVERELVDRIYVNCALTRPPAAWLSRLREGGKMILALTELGPGRHGGVFWFQRGRDATHAARFIQPIRMFPCSAGRHSEDEQAIAPAFERGGEDRVRSLRTDAHALGDDCWLHADAFCLSSRGVE
jgi:protein-L-isoaspartate(D-aspartate) O-methyltransferase